MKRGAFVIENFDHVQYWIDSAEGDHRAARNLFASGDYHWSLFLGHLVLEKLLKAIFVQRFGDHPPRTHDLALMAERCKLEMDDPLRDRLDLFTRFNIRARYPDYKHEIYRLCTREYTEQAWAQLEEIRKWLLSSIRA